jgi:hypothetical protein
MDDKITVNRAALQRLVVAAREVAFGSVADSVAHDAELRAMIAKLDAASEAFAGVFAWHD